MLGEEGIENGDRPLLLSEGGVGARRRGHLTQRVVDRDLHVLGEPLIQPGHAIGVGLEPSRVGSGVGIAVEGRGGRDEPALSCGPRGERRGMPGGLGSLNESGAGGPAGERIAPGVERLPPVRHRAAGVGLQDLIEGAVALLPPERMEHSHRVLEALPSLRRAGDRKNHSTQFSDLVLVAVLLRVKPFRPARG